MTDGETGRASAAHAAFDAHGVNIKAAVKKNAIITVMSVLKWILSIIFSPFILETPLQPL
jgi:hypothetical protein